MPIVVIYGDNISKEPSELFNVDVWRIASQRGKDFVDAINRHGGDATYVSLPDIGIKGNTHAVFADLNNQEIAERLAQWLQAKGLDKQDKPHTGPKQLHLEKASIPLQQ